MLFSTKDPDPGRDMGTWTHTAHPLSQESELKCDSQSVSRENMDEVISCTQPDCTCQCFQPGRVSLRSCDRCKHGWVAHAVSKLSAGAVQCSGQVEIVQCSVVFDISTLLLYGTQALPVRMKILLDRLFSVLTHTQVITILHTLGWTLRDYIRGYILQDSMGKALDRWVIMSPEDEEVTLQQFLRFGETKSIVELMAVQEQQDHLATVPRTTKTDSDIRLFIESSSHHRSLQSNTAESETPPSLHHFENLPGGNLAFLLPFQYSSQPSSSPLAASSTLFQEAPAAACRQQPTRHNSKSHGADSSDSMVPLRGSKLPFISNKSADEKSCRDKRPESETGKSASRLAPASFTSQCVPDPQVLVEETQGPCSSSSSISTGVREGALSFAVRKGRVSCSACGKTFYDKGTLKIHYNAVHLKIKHRCTIEGCNMVFSSLRSRNRHSANPNPRLHTPAMHHTHSPPHQQASAQPCATVLPSRVRPSLDVSPTGMSSSVLEASHTPLMFSSMKAVQPVPPFYSTSRNSPIISSPGVTKDKNVTSVTDQPLKHNLNLSRCESSNTARPGGGASTPLTTNQDGLHSKIDTVPKKKSRKSSMPVKIKREIFDEQNLLDCKDEENEEEDEEDDNEEEDEIRVYFINGLMSPQSSQMEVQPPSGLSYSSLAACCSRRPWDDGEIHLGKRRKTSGKKIQQVSCAVLKSHRSSSSFNNSSTHEDAACERNEGVMEKRVKRETQEGEGDKWRESKGRGGEERGLCSMKVKEEEFDPSYDLYWAKRAAAATSDPKNDCKSGPEEEDPDTDQQSVRGLN